MSFWTLLDGGFSIPSKKTWGQRFACRYGYWQATRNRNTKIHTSCLISPEAHIHPRSGSIQIGEDSVISLGVLLQGNISIGKNSSIQAYSNIVGYGTIENPTGKIIIGDNVRIASHTMLIAANHVFDDVEKPIAQQGLKPEPIVIEDNVWIGGRVNITAGVRIGTGSVIGAGSVVTKDIPPYSIAVGVPAKVIKSRIG